MEGTSRATGKADHRRRQPRVPVHRRQRIYLWLPRVWTWIQFKNVLWFRTRPGAEGARLQLAQRDRVLVVRAAGDRRRRRRADLVSVGEQSRVSPGWRDAAARRPHRNSVPAEQKPPTYYVTTGIDASWAAAIAEVPAWRTITHAPRDQREGAHRDHR